MSNDNDKTVERQYTIFGLPADPEKFMVDEVIRRVYDVPFSERTATLAAIVEREEGRGFAVEFMATWTRESEPVLRVAFTAAHR